MIGWTCEFTEWGVSVIEYSLICCAPLYQSAQGLHGLHELIIQKL